MFIGEKLIDAGDLGWLSGTRATLRNTGIAVNLTGAMPIAPGPGYLDQQEQLIDQGGYLEGAAPDELPASDNESSSEQKDGKSTEPDSGQQTASLGVGGFASRHPAGANFAMGDGHISFIRNDADPLLLQQLGHRADGKLIGSGDYH